MAAVGFFDVHFVSSSRVEAAPEVTNITPFFEFVLVLCCPGRSGDLAYPTVGWQNVMAGRPSAGNEGGESSPRRNE
jgi:hypothetical protein